MGFCWPRPPSEQGTVCSNRGSGSHPQLKDTIAREDSDATAAITLQINVTEEAASSTATPHNPICDPI
jgi:hypothetical protein